MGIDQLHERDRLAKQVIERYARLHCRIDTGIGLFGLLPLCVPLPPLSVTGPISIVAAIGVAFPIHYRLARELAAVYEAPSSALKDAAAAVAGGAGVVLDTGPTIAAAAIADQVVSELPGIILDHLGEITLGFLLSFIPILGGLASLWLDRALAATTTWTLGIMIVLYYRNGKRFINDKPRDTKGRAKGLVTGFNARCENRVNFDDIDRNNPEINEQRIKEAEKLVVELLTTEETATEAAARAMLRHLDSYSDEQIDEAIRRAKVTIAKMAQDQ